jgi:hypothetical protein
MRAVNLEEIGKDKVGAFRKSDIMIVGRLAAFGECITGPSPRPSPTS